MVLLTAAVSPSILGITRQAEVTGGTLPGTTDTGFEVMKR